jgi:hypothetical protein
MAHTLIPLNLRDSKRVHLSFHRWFGTGVVRRAGSQLSAAVKFGHCQAIEAGLPMGAARE